MSYQYQPAHLFRPAKMHAPAPDAMGFAGTHGSFSPRTPYALPAGHDPLMFAGYRGCHGYGCGGYGQILEEQQQKEGALALIQQQIDLALAMQAGGAAGAAAAGSIVGGGLPAGVTLPSNLTVEQILAVTQKLQESAAAGSGLSLSDILKEIPGIANTITGNKCTVDALIQYLSGRLPGRASDIQNALGSGAARTALDFVLASSSVLASKVIPIVQQYVANMPDVIGQVGNYVQEFLNSCGAQYVPAGGGTTSGGTYTPPTSTPLTTMQQAVFQAMVNSPEYRYQQEAARVARGLQMIPISRVVPAAANVAAGGGAIVPIIAGLGLLAYLAMKGA